MTKITIEEKKIEEKKPTKLIVSDLKTGEFFIFPEDNPSRLYQKSENTFTELETGWEWSLIGLLFLKEVIRVKNVHITWERG